MKDRICSKQGQNVSQVDEVAQCKDGRGNAPTQRVVVHIPEREMKMKMNRSAQVCLSIFASMYVYVCVCLYVYSHACTCSCDTHILQMGRTCIMNYYTLDTSAKLCITTLKSAGEECQAMKSTVDVHIIIVSVQSPKSYALSTHHHTYKSIKFVLFPKVSGMPPSNTLSFRNLKRRNHNTHTDVFFVSSQCRDALKKKIVSTPPQGQGLQ